MNLNLEKITQMAVDTFYIFKRRETIKLKIEYVDDLYTRRLQLAHTEKEINDIINSKNFIRGLNGTMILPKSKDETFYILISKAILNDTYFIGTIIHELTHIYDFIDFASAFCNDNYEIVESHNLFGMFYYWTEFNARRNGYYYYRKIIFKIEGLDLSEEEQVNHILTSEYKLHYNRLLENLREYYNDHNERKYIYYIVQFMGRLSVLEELFPKKISGNNHLPDYLVKTYGKKIIELYNVLFSMKDFSTAISKLKLLESSTNALFI